MEGPYADLEYLAFVEELKKEPAALPSAEAQAALQSEVPHQVYGLRADPEYLAFVEELTAEPAALPSAEAQAARRAAEAAAGAGSEPAAAMTPLIASLLQQRAAKGDRGRGGQVRPHALCIKADRARVCWQRLWFCSYVPTGGPRRDQGAGASSSSTQSFDLRICLLPRDR